MIKEEALLQARTLRHQGVDRIRKDLTRLYRPLIRDLLEEYYRKFTDLDERHIAALGFTHANLYQKIENAKPEVAAREYRVLLQLYAQHKLPETFFDELNCEIIGELVQVISARMRATPALLPDVHFALSDFRECLAKASQSTG